MENIINNVTEVVKNAPLHPFYPLEVEIAGYLVNTYSVPILLALFAAWMGVILYATRHVVKRFQPDMIPTERLTIMWFMLSKLAHLCSASLQCNKTNSIPAGSIHLFFEGIQAILSGLTEQTSLRGFAPLQVTMQPISETWVGYRPFLDSCGRSMPCPILVI